MGVKSTISLSRSEAEVKYLELLLVERMEALKRQLKSSICLLDDAELEKRLVRSNDMANNGEGYENYMIEES